MTLTTITQLCPQTFNKNLTGNRYKPVELVFNFICIITSTAIWAHIYKAKQSSYRTLSPPWNKLNVSVSATHTESVCKNAETKWQLHTLRWMGTTVVYSAPQEILCAQDCSNHRITTRLPSMVPSNHSWAPYVHMYITAPS